MVGLVNKDHVGAAVPAPIPGDSVILVEALFDDGAGAITGEEAIHGAGSGASVEPDGELVRLLTCLDKPKEQVGRVVARYTDPASVLLL